MTDALVGAAGAACSVVTVVWLRAEVAGGGQHGDDDAGPGQGGEEWDEEQSLHCKQG